MSCQRALLCSVAFVLAACSTDTEPLTQIVVVVDSDFSGLTRFEAEVRGFEEPTTVTADLDDEPLPRRFSLVHDGGPLGPMAVTVRAYTDSEEPILIEPRTGMFFKAGQTLLLKIDLLSACVGLCDEDEACIAPGECVPSDEAAVLVPWSGPPDGLENGGPLDGGMDGMIDMPDGSMNEAGMQDSGGDGAPAEDSGPREDADVEPDATDPDDAIIDAGDDAIVVDPTWPYQPSNVVLDDDELSALPRKVLLVDCPMATIDSSTPASSTFCHGAPEMVVLEQPGGGEVLVVVLSQLQVDADTTLKLVGSRPVILLVEGDASIAGTIDASADGAIAGPGGADSTVCGTATGGTGTDAPSSGLNGASGGSGGGFGSAGSAGGTSGSSALVAAGTVSGDATLVPLRGGCSGGAGGLGKSVVTNAAPGGGGGALQLSVAGTLVLSGVLDAGGGGGAPGQGVQGGGAGGGSGGAILLEAASYSINPLAVIAANGGGGGGGQPGTSPFDSTAGGNGTASTTASTAGVGSSNGGDGGRGAALEALATDGGTSALGGTCFPANINCNWGGAGGGAGGLGRVRLVGASSCVLPGTYSPAARVTCETCGVCSVQPDPSCTEQTAATGSYWVCSSTVSSSTARMLCQNSDADLVKIDNSTENAYLKTLLAGAGDDVLIGASDVVEDDWRWVVDNTAFWLGDEGGDAVGSALEDWRTGEPNGSGDCSRLTSDGWADVDCADTYPFICEQQP